MKRKRNQKISSPIKKIKESKDDIGKNDDSGKEEEKLEYALLMVLTRRIAYRKAKGGFLHVLQRGSVLENPSEATVKGIIRLQLAP